MAKLRHLRIMGVNEPFNMTTRCLTISMLLMFLLMYVVPSMNGIERFRQTRKSVLTTAVPACANNEIVPKVASDLLLASFTTGRGPARMCGADPGGKSSYRTQFGPAPVSSTATQRCQ
eukprot:IDg5105t1